MVGCYSETDPDSSAEAGGKSLRVITAEPEIFSFFFVSFHQTGGAIRAASAKRHQDGVGLTAMETLEHHPSPFVRQSCDLRIYIHLQ